MDSAPQLTPNLAHNRTMERTDRSTPTLTSGRAAGLLVVLGLLLLLTGAVAYVITNAAPANAAANGEARTAAPKAPLDTTAFDSILNTGQRLIDDQKYAQAEALYKQVLSSHPEAQAIHVEYARLLAGQKRAPEAYAQYQAALALGPVDPEVLLEAGTAANMAGHPERAAEHYAAAQAASPSDYRAPLFLAQVQIKLKQAEAAKVNLLHVTKLNPTAAAPAWATLAQLALTEDKPDMALTYVAHARELDRKSTVYRVLQARAHKRGGDAQAALDLLIGLSDAEKHEPGVMQVMAECFGMLQRPADAAKMYVDASEAEPTKGDWAFQAAVWLEKAGDKPKALTYAQRAATLNVDGAAQLADRLNK